MHSVNSCRHNLYPWLFLSFAWLSIMQSQGSFASPMPSPVTPSCARAGCIYVRLPVNWGILRSGFNTLDVPLEAENSSEYWAILYKDPDDIELLTPHGRARVIGIKSGFDSNTQYPDILVLNEVEFSRILGLEFNPLIAAEQTIFIDLPIHDSTDQTLVLKTSSKFFISLHLSISL